MDYKREYLGTYTSEIVLWNEVCLDGSKLGSACTIKRRSSAQLQLIVGMQQSCLGVTIASGF